ncbi:carbon-nitrogen hydrolase family protein [Paenibacillus hemerocallicola]|uniref:Carbon-nitrogen hydrolase family protein n=1 Tax=Paenibacillus hemerocallicola TaxID=1172614 RepID=A0A5C4T6R2_9BACL|nr:carbon-nitrogen hydrolase family protein [Paenibacillus hemerocallicola]TNJ63929.1 carbon-nitrogen hydrolase family protein [Paenibacillus hemerocallicola]
MARYVKISCLSAPQLRVDPKTDLQETVELMIRYWERQLEQVLPDNPDIIVLPECCDRPEKSGYPLDRMKEYYRHRGDRIRDYFAGIARRHSCYIAYSAVRELADGSFRNSTQLIDRQGQVAGIYNKNHLVEGERTKGDMLYGKDAPVFETDFGRVACAICFDLNFDELRLKYVGQRPELILFSSAYHGGLMQQYWAYSCRAHFAGSVYTHAPSSIISPVGEIIATSTNYYHYVTRTINLDCEVIHIDYNGAHFRKMKNKYGDKISIHDPGLLGSVIIASETDEFTVHDLIREFGLEPLDDYWQRALAHRCAPGNLEE